MSLFHCLRSQTSLQTLQFGKHLQPLKVSRNPLLCIHSRTFSGQAIKLSKIRWRRGLIFTSLAFGGYYTYREICVVTDIASDYKVKFYKLLPLNFLSRIWGKVNSIDLPIWMREPAFKLYIKAFNVDLDEAAIRDLKHYGNLGEFFKRRLRPTSRPINKTNKMVSPCDGKVLHFGLIEDGWIEQVKGVTYSLPGFLGPDTWPSEENGYSYRHINKGNTSQDPVSEKQYEDGLIDGDKALYHCVLYLAPGDYHGFHSPVEWIVSMRRHFPGHLLSVNPRIAQRIRGLFNLNERAIYVGEWEQGFMSMAAVGATNVGSIKVYFDEYLKTSQPMKYPEGTYMDEVFARKDLGGIPLKKGEPVGEFNLGSTIVLIFEAPKTFQFKIKSGQVIKMGQPVGCYKNLLPDLVKGS